YAGYFDIQWAELDARGPMILPLLGAALDEVIAQGQLRVARGRMYEDAPEIIALRVYDRWLPLTPASWIALIEDMPPSRAIAVHARSALETIFELRRELASYEAA